MDDSKCRYGLCCCQRYKAKKDVKDDCQYCNHSVGFHEIPFADIDIKEHPYGQCQTCHFCQRYKEGTQADICTYCGHSLGYHLSWPTTPIITSGSAAPTTLSTGRTVGRPEADSITIKYLICFDKVTSNKIPKEGKYSWSELEKKNLIKDDVTISRTDDVLNKIRNLFGLNQGWKLYSAKKGKPIEVNGEINFGLIKSNITKANQRLYIGPNTHDIVDAVSSVNTNKDVSNQHIDEFFNGVNFDS